MAALGAYGGTLAGITDVELMSEVQSRGLITSDLIFEQIRRWKLGLALITKYDFAQELPPIPDTSDPRVQRAVLTHISNIDENMMEKLPPRSNHMVTNYQMLSNELMASIKNVTLLTELCDTCMKIHKGINDHRQEYMNRITEAVRVLVDTFVAKSKDGKRRSGVRKRDAKTRAATKLVTKSNIKHFIGYAKRRKNLRLLLQSGVNRDAIMSITRDVPTIIDDDDVGEEAVL
mmetsp:Transcript_100281/g.299322  ORF Transcript_100281/g.299322 Transcript_100281/m.299322 type:complete len:232 (+) Transcript_100281:50-745(+)